ncbi:MAG: pyridoxal-phosphate dependent enzyme [Calditrichaeota bacterium]|nr:MAG: pyridoxal-phosphate dependent enzyme [Calditrichota bacterium]
MSSAKFTLRCQSCGARLSGMKEWFEGGQCCPQCGSKQGVADFKDGYNKIETLTAAYQKPESLWHYLDYLPLTDPAHIVSYQEGIVDMDRWTFVEQFAREHYNLHIRVYAHRNDQNPATGTFKDLAGTMVASVLKENGYQRYVAASTGNIANAFAKYLATAGIELFAFIPKGSSPFQVSSIKSYGQHVFRVEGDYSRAKDLAAEFAKDKGIPLAAGNYDPMRVEAKKIMVYEWLRLLPEQPTVYIQALSGGTGPIGIQKALDELKEAGHPLKAPRQILVQSDKCAPMARAWARARAAGFPDNWEQDYPIIENPETEIQTLSTGNPATYPVIGPLVRQSGGEIISGEENMAVLMARMVALETSTIIGPAAAIPVAGLFRALREGYIHDGDIIVLNVGEGASRAPEFMSKLAWENTTVKSLEDIRPNGNSIYRKKLWRELDQMLTA